MASRFGCGILSWLVAFFFFFQAEDGIRDYKVTGVQTCALPIYRIIAVLPFFHIYGMQVVLNLALWRGATLVTMPRFELEPFLATVQQYRISRAFVVPPLVLALAQHPAVDRYDLSSLRAMMSGAAPLEADLETACARRLGCGFIQGYGLTEASPVTHANSDEPGKCKIGRAHV